MDDERPSTDDLRKEYFHLLQWQDALDARMDRVVTMLGDALIEGEPLT